MNESLTLELAQHYIGEGIADAASFARWLLPNPDLVRRLREGREIAPFDRRTLAVYGGPRGLRRLSTRWSERAWPD
jgi:2,4-dienoyl-CoA reductase-like NADH-dependent reductase (Old Yellow Enzyme family)